MTQRYNIDTCALLVEFNASVWTARKLDKGATDEVVISKRAGAKDAARVNKHLLAGRNELDVIQKHVNNVRTYVYENTLPWSDSGLRLLPTVNFQKFAEKMNDFEDEFAILGGRGGDAEGIFDEFGGFFERGDQILFHRLRRVQITGGIEFDQGLSHFDTPQPAVSPRRCRGPGSTCRLPPAE